ncbi:hypothetical protein CPC08DRAFT_306116 [Agrocybe pediades]|nr:hypothetical protein CPC08DRAFT_306116 [Agrocybe pediades]
MLHLQKELSQRRDKRLELASRKRSYEVANATTRRKADESGVWSWWKAARDDLQTEMIAEASRKRRRLERGRRLMEKTQPVRRIPLPPHIDIHSLPPLPNLRKMVKSFQPAHRKHSKSGKHHSPKNLAYPEIPTLSSNDIAQDLEFLFQNRRLPTTFDIQQGSVHAQHLQQQQNYSSQYAPQRNGTNMGPGMQGPGVMPMNRPSSLGLGNGSMQPQPSSMGHPAMMHQGQHGMGYDQYGDVPPQYGPGGPVPSSGRMREHAGNYPPGGPQPGSSRDPMGSYSNFPGRQQQPSQVHGPPMPGNSGGQGQHMHGYPGDHEMSTIGPAVGPVSSNGAGQQHLPHHPYFGPGNMGSNNAQNGHSHPASSHMQGGHGKGMNGRRSISPVHVASNGTSNMGPASKANGHWMGPGMGMGNYVGNGGKGGDWDTRAMHEEEERERMLRERERDRKRDEREREKELNERERLRHRELQDMERERQREHQHAQQQYRQGPPPAGSSNLPPLHVNGVSGPATQGSNAVPHHHVPHHHHRTHHHHVVHHHHTQGPQHASSSLPPSGTGGAPIVHSPRSTREYDSRPGSGHPLPTEVITLSSGKTSQIPLGIRERDVPSHWSTKPSDELPHSSHLDYRDRERDNRDRERDSRKAYNPRQSSGPPMIPLDDRGDRPMAMPFVMASSQTMQQVNNASGPHLNGSAVGSSTSSPRGPSWNTPAADDPAYRMSNPSGPTSGYSSAHDSRSPVQAHRYPAGAASHPLGRMSSSNSSSAHHHRMGTPPPPPSNRARPPPSPSYSMSVSASQRSPVTRYVHSP